MRLVEVVVLMGAHCISPVEHTQMTTEVGKVQCAVVIEKDTDRNTVRVTPETAARDPRVAAAIAHIGLPDGTRIVPAFAPAGSPATVTQMPAAQPQPDAGHMASAAAQPITPETGMAAADAPSAAAGDDLKTTADANVIQEDPSARKTVTVAEATKPAATPAPARKPAAAQPQPARKQVAAADQAPKQKNQCKGSAVPKWYKTADGHRKFRCVRPVPTSDKPVPQLY